LQLGTKEKTAHALPNCNLTTRCSEVNSHFTYKPTSITATHSSLFQWSFLQRGYPICSTTCGWFCSSHFMKGVPSQDNNKFLSFLKIYKLLSYFHHSCMYKKNQTCAYCISLMLLHKLLFSLSNN